MNKIVLSFSWKECMFLLLQQIKIRFKLLTFKKRYFMLLFLLINYIFTDKQLHSFKNFIYLINTN